MSRPHKVESIAELRRICQDPVRKYNDLTGAVYGWRLSIYLTKVLLTLRMHASAASIAMVLSGLIGSLLLLFGGWFLVAGLAVLTLAYVLDCVDGEMARYQGIDSYRWAGVDFLHHMFTKGLSSLFLGIGLYLEYGQPWILAAGGAGSIFWLLLMGVRDLPMLLFAKKIVLNRRRNENPAYQRMQEILDKINVNGGIKTKEERLPDDLWGADFKFAPWVVRAFFMSFDIVIPMYMVAAIIDQFVPPFELFGTTMSVTMAMVYAYAFILPIHTIDTIYHAMRRGQVRNELYELANEIEEFRERK